VPFILVPACCCREKCKADRECYGFTSNGNAGNGWLYRCVVLVEPSGRSETHVTCVVFQVLPLLSSQ